MMSAGPAFTLTRLLPVPLAHLASGWTGHAKQLLYGCAAVLGVQAGPAQSTAARPQVLPPPMASLQVSPLVAAAGVSRQISITSYWPVGNGPTEISVIDSELQSSKTVVIRMQCADDIWCALPLVPYHHLVDFTPSFEGDLKVVVLSSCGEVIARQTTLKTRNLRGSFSQFDISGRWCDQASDGAGLTFVHVRRRRQSDDVAGAWCMHDANGQPRHYAIRDVAWKEGGMEAEGNIFETDSGSRGTPIRTSQLGRARIVLQNDKYARVYAIGFRGSVLFMSNVVRALA